MFDSIKVKFYKIQANVQLQKMYHWRSSKSAITKGHKEFFLWCKYAHYFDYGFGIATAQITHLNMYH